MPYTNPWDVTSPPGTELAKNIDNQARRLRVDIGERMNEIFVDFSVDPLVVKPILTGTVVGKQLVLPFPAFVKSSNGKEAEYRVGYCYAFSDTGDLVASLGVIPIGCTITKVETLVDRGDSTGVTTTLYARAFAAGGARPGSNSAMTSIGTSATAGAGVVITDMGVLAIVIAANTQYYVGVKAGGPAGNSFDFYGVRVTYNTPDVRNTR